MAAFVPSQPVLTRPRRHRTLLCRRHTTPTANYISPDTLNVDLTSRARSGNFGAVFFGMMCDENTPGGSTDVVVKLPIDSDIGRKLYDMERHSNAKLARQYEQLDSSPETRVADYLGELIVPPDTPVAGGLGRLGLVWRRAASDDTLEDYLRGSQLSQLASVLGTTATASPLRRELAGALLRQLALVLADIQSCGIVHRDFKPENILVVPNSPPNARFKMIDFGSSCDWSTPLKKGLGIATLDPVYFAPEKRLNIFRPALRFDVYSAGLITLRAAMPSLTDASAMRTFVSKVLARCDGSFEKAVAGINKGRYPVSPDLERDMSALDQPVNDDMFVILSTMLAARPEDRAEVSDCLQSRFLRSLYVA